MAVQRTQVVKLQKMNPETQRTPLLPSFLFVLQCTHLESSLCTEKPYDPQTAQTQRSSARPGLFLKPSVQFLAILKSQGLKIVLAVNKIFPQTTGNSVQAWESIRAFGRNMNLSLEVQVLG